MRINSRNQLSLLNFKNREFVAQCTRLAPYGPVDGTRWDLRCEFSLVVQNYAAFTFVQGDGSHSKQHLQATIVLPFSHSPSPPLPVFFSFCWSSFPRVRRLHSPIPLLILGLESYTGRQAVLYLGRERPWKPSRRRVPQSDEVLLLHRWKNNSIEHACITKTRPHLWAYPSKRST